MELHINVRKKAIFSVDWQMVLLNATLRIQEGEEKRKKHRCGKDLKPQQGGQVLEGEVTSECPVPSLDVALAVAIEYDRGCVENSVKCDS